MLGIELKEFNLTDKKLKYYSCASRACFDLVPRLLAHHSIFHSGNDDFPSGQAGGGSRMALRGTPSGWFLQRCPHLAPALVEARPIHRAGHLTRHSLHVLRYATSLPFNLWRQSPPLPTMTTATQEQRGQSRCPSPESHWSS